MLDADFELATNPQKKEYLLDESSAEYLKLPTVNSLNCHIDEVIRDSMDGNCEAPESDHFVPLHTAKKLVFLSLSLLIHLGNKHLKL